jgi:hypothetical protein
MVGGSSLRGLGGLLQDPAGLDRLIGEIDELEERHAEPG